jgi:hypothetical protein
MASGAYRYRAHASALERRLFADDMLDDREPSRRIRRKP